MRLRGLVFERFVTFERAEVNLCDERGTPLDVVLFVGDSGSGKTALLRGVAGLLAEAASGAQELGAADVRRGHDNARCRAVFDDVVDARRVVVTLEKELTRDERPDRAAVRLRASPPEAFERWRGAIAEEATSRAAFSIASFGHEPETEDADATDPLSRAGSAEGEDPLFAWLFEQRGGPHWEGAVSALDRILWPWCVHQMTPEGELIFSMGASERASSQAIGDGFESVLVLTLELLRLSRERPDEELVYVIDDIDQHLHPRWQSRLLGDLRRAFPRVQIVATTHSPYVVASVEPHQVFRLEPERTAGSAIVRVSERVQKGALVSQVMDLAFGAPDLPGPRWVHTPSASIRREVMSAVDGDLTRGAVVYVLPEPVHVRDVRDAFGERAFSKVEGSVGNVFFIDREPGSPWGHPCEYVFRTREGALSRHRAIWPPEHLTRFVPIGRG